MSKQRISYVVYDNYNSDSHNAGINSLALDTNTPGGLLYTAGKDTKINSWNLHLNSENSNPYYVYNSNDYSNINEGNGIGMMNHTSLYDIMQDECINCEVHESPDSIKDQLFKKYVHSDNTTRRNSFNQTPSAIAIKNPLVKLKQQSSISLSVYHRQNSNGLEIKRKRCILNRPTLNRKYIYHSDWVNDIILTKSNEYLISASSDRSIYLWNVNKSIPITRVGSHKDEVRTLAYSSNSNWIASGGFDQRVLFWDLAEGRSKPIFTSDDSLTQASIYSMATNEDGNILVTGSPERIVRIWDTKMGKQVLKLTGHSDNVRALLVSADGKWVLSGSSDTSIKLWSLANTRRCVLTYSHYTDSVWSLTSNDPYLRTFWAGGRDGWITKVSQSVVYDGNSQYDNDYGDCILISKENSGVNKLVAVENGYIWAATNSSTINCWRDIPIKLSKLKSISNNFKNEEYEKVVIPKSSLIIQPANIINDSYYSFNHIQSVASVDTARSRSSSIPGNFLDNDFSSRQVCDEFVVPIFSEPEIKIIGQPAIIKYTLLNNKRNVLTKDTETNVDEWDIILCKKVKSYGKADYNKVLEEINKKEWIESWCSVDIRTGALNIMITKDKIFESYIYFDELNVDEEPLIPDSRINVGRWVLTYLFYNFVMSMHEKKLQIKQSDNNSQLTKSDRQYSDSNLAEKTESNLSIRCLTPLMMDENYSIPESSVVTNISKESTKKEFYINNENNDSTTIKEETTEVLDKENVESEESLNMKSEEKSIVNEKALNGLENNENEKKINNSNNTNNVVTDNNKTPTNSNRNSMLANQCNSPSNVHQPNTNDMDSYKSNMSSNNENTGTYLKVKEKSFIKKIKSHVHRRTSSSVKSSNDSKDTIKERCSSSSKSIISQKDKSTEEIDNTPINFNECPYISLPDDVPIIISNLEAENAYSYIDIDRQTVKSLGDANTTKLIYDYGILPKWVYDCIIDKKIPNSEVRKINFILKPYPGSDMAELPAGNNHLCANRMLRIRKVITYVVEKLGLVPSKSNNNISSLSNISCSSTIKAENWIEIICNNTIMKPTDTIATCKYHYWKAGGDVVLNYRYILKEVK